MLLSHTISLNTVVGGYKFEKAGKRGDGGYGGNDRRGLRTTRCSSDGVISQSLKQSQTRKENNESVTDRSRNLNNTVPVSRSQADILFRVETERLSLGFRANAIFSGEARRTSAVVLPSSHSVAKRCSRHALPSRYLAESPSLVYQHSDCRSCGGDGV